MEGGGPPPADGNRQDEVAPPNPADRLDQLDRQLENLASSLAGHVAGAQEQTLEHLVLFEEAVHDLEDSARQSATRAEELLLAAKRLATELRGLDLLAGHVKSVKELVKKLEAQVDEVVAAEKRGGQ